MPDPVRVTGPLLDVLEVLVAAAVTGGDAPHGWAIMRSTGRSGPTVYGVLDRLEDAGWIAGSWQDQPPEANRPRRRVYRLTGTGSARARSLLLERRPETARSGRLTGPAFPRIVPRPGGAA
jgi:PadR family transcriptional regulator